MTGGHYSTGVIIRRYSGVIYFSLLEVLVLNVKLSGSAGIPRNACVALRIIVMHDYQESVTTGRTDKLPTK